MKKWITLFLACLLVFACTAPASAADGKVTYSGNAGSFVFEPGSEHSLTDLFPNFKGVMPGDTLTQKITVRNEADNKVKVNIYLRAQGAHQDSQEFLSQLKLQVKASEENTAAYMFDAAASEKAQLYEWVCLGTLYSGGEVDLDVTLSVPAQLDNRFQDQVGYLDWEFMVEELEIEDTDPEVPPTGDNSQMVLWIVLMALSLTLMILLPLWRRKKKEQNA